VKPATKLDIGVCLLSHPLLQGDTFSRRVVLLTHKDETGYRGVIMNANDTNSIQDILQGRLMFSDVMGQHHPYPVIDANVDAGVDAGVDVDADADAETEADIHGSADTPSDDDIISSGSDSEPTIVSIEQSDDGSGFTVSGPYVVTPAELDFALKNASSTGGGPNVVTFHSPANSDTDTESTIVFARADIEQTDSDGDFTTSSATDSEEIMVFDEDGDAEGHSSSYEDEQAEVLAWPKSDRYTQSQSHSKSDNLSQYVTVSDTEASIAGSDFADVEVGSDAVDVDLTCQQQEQSLDSFQPTGKSDHDVMKKRFIELLQDVKLSFGGPVPCSLQYVFFANANTVSGIKAPPGSVEVAPSIFWNGGVNAGRMLLEHFEQYDSTIATGESSNNDSDATAAPREATDPLRVFFNDSLWGVRQLEREVEAGMWFPVHLSPDAFLFDRTCPIAADELWQQSVRALGGEHIQIAEFPSSYQPIYT
jgi:putative AlgH/UPF0301 family transcriptional regulator